MPNLLPSPILTLNTNVGPPQGRPPSSYPYSYSSLEMEGHGDTPNPRTNQDWKDVLFSIKRDYLNRKHRSCVSRCRQLLTTAKTQGTAQPAHLIYLHFYAASALEMQAKPLNQSSPHRAQLLAQARDHYRRASVITEAEGDSAATRLSRATNPSLPPSLSPSLLQSPVLTEDNGGMSTRTSSPDPSIFSDRGDDTAASQASKLVKSHHRKQVSFGDISFVTEPFIRPDSPTLALGDSLSPISPVVSPSMVPMSRFNTSLPGLRNILFLGEDSEDENEVEEEEEEEEDEEEVEEEGEEEVAEESTRQQNLTSALDNYSSTLSFLGRQIRTHMSAVNVRPPVSLLITDSDEMRRLDLEARIARLRENGWRRPRFDAARHKALGEAALAEMGR